jgi:superfamily II DNA/RNA helicase
LWVLGTSVLVATPGRLLQFVRDGVIGLSRVRFVVIDEADRMLDDGFQPAINDLFSFPEMPEKTKRQTLMFSATFPESVQEMAGQMLNPGYAFLTVGKLGECSFVLN